MNLFALQTRLCSSISTRRIGVVGVGNVGRSICRNLIKNSYNLVGISDLNKEVLKEFPSDIERFDSAGQLAAKCDVVLTALPTPNEVREALEGPGGVFDNLQPKSLWIDHSTTDYEQTIRLVKKMEEKGSDALEAPVTGGMALLKQGKMTVLVGGKKTIFDHAQPLLKQSCQNVLYMGDIGSATITKVISNMLAGAHTVVMGEAVMMAKRSGVDLKAFFDGIRLSAGNSYVFETETPLVFNGTYDPNFAIALHCKDFKLGNEIARKFKSPIPVYALVEQIYNQAKIVYGDDAGSSHPPKLLEDSLGESLQIPGFDNWTYTIEQVEGGSIGVVQTKKDKIDSQ